MAVKAPHVWTDRASPEQLGHADREKENQTMAVAKHPVYAYLKDDPNPPKMPELKEFRQAHTTEEWEAYRSQVPEAYQVGGEKN